MHIFLENDSFTCNLFVQILFNHLMGPGFKLLDNWTWSDIICLKLSKNHFIAILKNWQLNTYIIAKDVCTMYVADDNTDAFRS